MRNQWSFRTKSRLKVVDNAVKISQVIGKKDSNWDPFYPTFTNTTVVLVSEDKRVYETTKATADWLGNLTFLKRWLADDWTDVEVTKFKKAWMPWTLMYVTFASEDYDKKADISSVPTKTSDLTNDSWFIDNTVNDLVNYTKTSDLWAVATSNNYNDLDNKLTAWANITIDWNNEISATDTIPNNATIKIQKNWSDIESFTANESTNKTINITVPTQASDVWALPNTTKYWSNLSLSINSTTYVVTAQLKDQDWNNMWTAQTIDLPLESVVVSGSYDDVNKKIVLTLQSWSTVEFSVADLVSWLQTEITNNNKLSADLVDDSNTTNKFVTASDLTKLSNTSGTNTWDQTASDFDIKDLADSTWKRTSWDDKLESWDNVSDLVNDAGYITSSDLSWYQTTANMVQNLNNADHTHYPTAKAVQDAITSSGWWDMVAATYDPNNVAWDAFDMDNMVQWTTNKFVSVADINNWDWKASVIWFPSGTTKAQINTILSWLEDLQQVLFSTANGTVTRAWLWNTAPNAAIKWIMTKYTATNSVHILAHTYDGDVFTVAYKYSNWTLLSSIEYKQTQLTAWSNITISWTTISATDTTYVASDFDIKDLTDSTNLRTAWSGKQDALVDWTNIKTINSQSITWSGNFDVINLIEETDYSGITPQNWALYIGWEE